MRLELKHKHSLKEEEADLRKIKGKWDQIKLVQRDYKSRNSNNRIKTLIPVHQVVYRIHKINNMHPRNL